MKPLVIALVVGCVAHTSLARAAGSCGDGGILGEQEQVTYEGSVYYVTTPDSYSAAQPWPLIIGLHGDEGDPADSVNYFWGDVPDGSFIFVAPRAPNASHSWYEEQETNSTWMDGLVATLRSLYNVDYDRTYMWGLSGGAVFSSRYVMTRQDVFAAAEFNMGGNGQDYVAPADPACKIPARWVVGPTDFLREGALEFYDEVTANGHETQWVDADCVDHCWDSAQMEDVARDWLLAHTLCGRTPTSGCDGNPGTGGAAGAAGSGGAAAGNGGASGGTTAAGGSTTAAGGSTTAAGGSAGTGGSATNPSAGGSAGSPPTGSAGAAGSTASGNPGGDILPNTAEGGCACSLPAQRGSRGRDLGVTLAMLGLSLLRRRRRD